MKSSKLKIASHLALIFAVKLYFAGFAIASSQTNFNLLSSNCLQNRCVLNRSAVSGFSSSDDTVSIKNFDNHEFTVILAFGQSNSANFGQSRYTCTQEVYNWHNSIIYKAQDPLKGASADHGSVWTRLADKMIVQGLARKILLVSIGVGSTLVSQWSVNGEYHSLLLETINKLKADGIEIDLILWHQGESDNLFNTSFDNYISAFEGIRTTLRQGDINAPVFIAIASYHPNENALLNKQLGCDTVIQNAQKHLVYTFPDLYLGPNTDILDKSYYRHDGVHFSIIGLEKHAEMWLEAIMNPKQEILEP